MLRDSFFKIDALKRAGKQWALNMHSNCRKKAVDGFRTIFKINEKMYKEKLKKEKKRLAKQGLKGKALE
jgi:hypothetical protein